MLNLEKMKVKKLILKIIILWKSPWRTKLSIPRRPGMVTLVLDGLPRSGPFKLEAGRRALALARDATLRALDTPIEDGVVRLAA
jgi:NTE family protein